MSESKLTRRSFLQITVLTPFGMAIGCRKEDTTLTTRVEALHKLVLALGPWNRDQQTQAENFADRFLTANHVSGEFLAQPEALRSLVEHEPFRDDPLGLSEIEFTDSPDQERTILESLVEKIYNLQEAVSILKGEPSVGTCIGRTQYTLAPG